MDNCLANQQTLTLRSIVDHRRSPIDSYRRLAIVDLRSDRRSVRALKVIAASGASHCQFSSLNLPLGPRSPAAKVLTGVLQNQPELFHLAAADELKNLADGREATNQRMILAVGSPEACLHRRIAELKEKQCQLAVEDILYLLICFKFSELRVHLVPKLSRCLYNGRLEISTSNDFALESLYSSEVLEIVKEHITATIGLRANSSVKEHWAITTISKSVLTQTYVASILYGYFLKSALLRVQLEQCVASESKDLPVKQRIKPLLLRHISNNVQSPSQEAENMRCYVTGFDPETVLRGVKLKSKEATCLIKSHTIALFGDENADEAILTSFSSLKRLVLEAVAFGSFLWDSEECVNTVYKLKDY